MKAFALLLALLCAAPAAPAAAQPPPGPQYRWNPITQQMSVFAYGICSVYQYSPYTGLQFVYSYTY